MKKTCQTCLDFRQSLFWFSVPFIVMLGFLFLMVSQNVFAETQVSIPIIAEETTCAESASCYLPSKVTIIVGETVTWSNDGLVFHTVTSGTPMDGRDGIFDSKIINAGKTFSHTFTEEGVYQYFCTIHPWMTGTVTVQ